MPDETPRLYLVTPIVDDPLVFLPQLEAALDAADVASVLLRIATKNAIEAESVIRAIAAPVQARGVALLIEGEAELVPIAGADGLHVARCGDKLTAAIKRLAPAYIVGAGALKSRDDAMRAGEAGADYVTFGDVGDDGAAPALDETLERTRWWAEIFTTPCVTLAQRLEDASAIAAAGADFVMLGEAVWTDPRGPAAAIVEAAARADRSKA